MFNKKVVARLTSVFHFGTRQVVIMLGNAIVAWLVLQQAGMETWGAFVKLFLLVALLCHVLNFGNRDFLLRAFASHPAQAKEDFQQAFFSRAGLIPLALAVAFAFTDRQLWFWITVWIFGQFLYHSLEVFIYYYKRFGTAALTEFVGLVVLLGLMANGNTDSDLLVQFYAISYSVRFIMLIVLLPNDAWRALSSFHWPDWSFFKKAKWFFLIGLSGLLQSRVDLYTISFFLSDQEVGQYQIMISFILLIQVVAGIILTPFSINLMRQDYITIRRTAVKMAVLGLIVASGGVALVYSLLSLLYDIDVGTIYYVWSFVLVYPTFAYLVWIYFLYGQKLERHVMRWNFIGAISNIIVTIILIQKLGILGALISSALVQVAIMFVMPILARRHLKP